VKSINVVVAASIALAAACGGGNAALSKSFSYGAPQALNAAEQSAASSAQARLTDTTAFSSSPDAGKGAAIVAFADAISSAALGGAELGGRRPTRPEIEGMLRAAALTDSCATVSGGTVTFKGCSESHLGFKLTLNGFISAKAGTVDWNLAGGFSGADGSFSIDVGMHQSGTLSVRPSRVSGTALSEVGGSVSAQGQSAGFGLATAVLVDLGYQTTPRQCVTDGTVEVKRVWTQKPAGASGPAFADAAVKLSWTGCEAVQVARSR